MRRILLNVSNHQKIPHDQVLMDTDKELWFNFGQPRQISEEEFLKLFDHLKFDAVLHSVAFPRLTLIRGTTNSLNEHNQGREDLVMFFKWLKSKGVKHIITVKVNDRDWPSHSDEAIESSLAPFKIEVLDWNKEDMCPVTIGKLGTTLREIDLYWSGKNSVLRAWSEKGEGLCRLYGLEKVFLHQEKVWVDSQGVLYRIPHADSH